MFILIADGSVIASGSLDKLEALQTETKFYTIEDSKGCIVSYKDRR